MNQTTTVQGDSRNELAEHLAGIQKALLSVVRLMDDAQTTDEPIQRNVQSQLEWAASHLHEAIRELGELGVPDARDGEHAGKERERSAEDGLMGGLHGHSRAIAIPEILGFVSSLRKSGVLRINAREECYLIQLERGSVVYAQGDDPPQGQLLGEILVNQGAIRREELEAIVRRTGVDRRRLGQVLLDEGCITKDQLCIALAFQVQLLFHRMYVAEDAVYQFDEDVRLSPRDDIRLNVTSLLLESARTVDEDARGE